MSSPKYRWWPFVKRMIRDYPELKKTWSDIHAQSITANYTGMPKGGGNGRTVENIALAGVVCDQDYAMFDYPTIIKNRGLNGYGEQKEETNKPETATTTKEGFTVEMRVLKNGCKGDDVKALQILLIGNGCTCGSWGADGNFGAATEQAVTNYQKKNKLQVDGIAGPETMKSLLGVS